MFYPLVYLTPFLLLFSASIGGISESYTTYASTKNVYCIPRNKLAGK